MSRDQSANQHIEYAQDRIRQTCLDRDPATYLECVTVEIISAQDHGRAESDLDAQQAMALWAKLMTVASVAGLGVTAIGVYLVWGTLDQTRAATNAAQDAVAVTREIGRLQTQAYLSFSGTELFYIGDQGRATSLYVRPKFKNTGQSPGKIVYGFCHVKFPTDFNAPLHYTLQRSAEYGISMNIGPGEERWITSPSIQIDLITSARTEGMRLVVIGCVEFTDVFDNVRRVEDFCVAISFHADPTVLVNGLGAAYDWNGHQDYSVKIT